MRDALNHGEGNKRRILAVAASVVVSLVTCRYLACGGDSQMRGALNHGKEERGPWLWIFRAVSMLSSCDITPMSDDVTGKKSITTYMGKENICDTKIYSESCDRETMLPSIENVFACSPPSRAFITGREGCGPRAFPAAAGRGHDARTAHSSTNILKNSHTKSSLQGHHDTIKWGKKQMRQEQTSEVIDDEYITQDSLSLDKSKKEETVCYEDFCENSMSNTKDIPQETNEEFLLFYDNLNIAELHSLATKFGPLLRKERFIFMDQYRRCWAGLIGHLLLVYSGERDTKPSFNIDLHGYEARPAPNYIQRDLKRRDMCFEIVCPGKKTFHVIALTNAFIPLPPASNSQGTRPGNPLMSTNMASGPASPAIWLLPPPPSLTYEIFSLLKPYEVLLPLPLESTAAIQQVL
uniref:Uncharacterized protein n=1 Tax=Timema poppense TaxID=170557 RepID=A0A7R9CZP1_TIMPO|nr:unnamed protein product [Timema poppensis]